MYLRDGYVKVNRSLTLKLVWIIHKYVKIEEI